MPLMGLEQDIFKGEKVVLPAEQPQAAIGAVEDVIDNPAGSNAGNARHGSRLASTGCRVKGRVPNAIRLTRNCIFHRGFDVL